MKLTEMMKRKTRKKQIPVQVMISPELHHAVSKQLEIDDLTWTTLLRSSMKLYLAEKGQPIPDLD